MKNLKVIITGILIVLFLGATFIKNLNVENKKIINNNALQFKQEYENLNGMKKGESEYKTINISENNPMVYSTYQEIETIITEGTGIIYFGFPECPWCRNAVPVLIDAAKEVGVDKIYYYNALEIRDTKSLDVDGNIIVEKEGTEEYKKLVELLYDYLEPYKGLNDLSIKRLYFPTVVFIKDGKIIGSQIGTVDSQMDPNISLTDKQYKELKELYSSYMIKTLGLICDNEFQNNC